MFKRIFKQWSKPIEDEDEDDEYDVDSLADAVKESYERMFLGPSYPVSARSAYYDTSTDSPMMLADTGGWSSYAHRMPVVYEHKVEKEFVYCDNCGCIIPDEQLEKVGNCNHCGAPPPKGLKRAR